ncbi:hypothetical protein IWX92DRAFT_412684 [Phyllosticta citricarpa]
MIPGISDEMIFNESKHFDTNQGNLLELETSLLSSGKVGSSSCVAEISPGEVQDWKFGPEIDAWILHYAWATDSSSMKSLAVLSIIFVPPSCIATIASMPMLSWQPGQLWIFWAYTVPITGTVIFFWIFYMFSIDPRFRRSRRRKCKEEGNGDASEKRENDLESASPSKDPAPEGPPTEHPSLRQILHLLWLYLFWR